MANRKTERSNQRYGSGQTDTKIVLQMPTKIGILGSRALLIKSLPIQVHDILDQIIGL